MKKLFVSLMEKLSEQLTIFLTELTIKVSQWIFTCFQMSREQQKALVSSSVSKELMPFLSESFTIVIIRLIVSKLNCTEHLLKFIFTFQFSSIVGTMSILSCVRFYVLFPFSMQVPCSSLFLDLSYLPLLLCSALLTEAFEITLCMYFGSCKQDSFNGRV